METAIDAKMGETEMEKFNVYANGEFWATCEAATAEEAIQIVADDLGTIDVGQEHARVDGMTAEVAE